MDFATELHMVLQVIVALILGSFIGWEREHHGTEAGIRTFGAIAVGACVFGLISLHGMDGSMQNVDPSRIASNVVVGVGFLGAGVIFRRASDSLVAGLTTAATLWSTAAIGLAVAFRMYVIAGLTTIIIFLLLWMPRLPWWHYISGKKRSGSKSKLEQSKLE